MNLSERGLALIKELEGYHTALPDGRCLAYICPAGKITIGWGCTRGIKLGMIWTKDQAEAALRKELAGHEAAVARLVTIDINSNQRDALILFAYNIGDEALRTSTLLKKLNKGDFVGAQAEFMRWIKHDDPDNPGKKIDSRGLANRRAKEAALFSERTEQENEVKGELIMPQAAVAPKEPMSPLAKVAVVGSGGVVAEKAVSKGAEALIAAPPPAVTDTVANVDVWNKLGKSAETLSTGLWKSPAFATALIVVLIACICGPWAWAKLKGGTSQ